MFDNITVLAGKNALEILRDEGLDPDRVRVMAGAAGGPKWLILGGLDRVIFNTFFKKRKKPLFMLGSSIGAWRFTALSRKNPSAAMDIFEREYLNQFYSPRPPAAEVSSVSRRILDRYLPDSKAVESLSHPFVRLNVMAVRSRLFLTREQRGLIAAGMTAAGLLNIFSRKNMRFFFERALFYDPRDVPPFIDMEGFPVQRIPLTAANLKEAVMASGSIPLIMEGVRNIPGARDGVYRDGGMIDYQFDTLFDPDPENIVLYPHYTDSVTPGWLDKQLPWRRTGGEAMHNVVLVSPSRKLISGLPLGKIPDRNDFMNFRGRDEERLAYWKTAIDKGKIVGDEFMEAVISKNLRHIAMPYSKK